MQGWSGKIESRGLKARRLMFASSGHTDEGENLWMGARCHFLPFSMRSCADPGRCHCRPLASSSLSKSSCKRARSSWSLLKVQLAAPPGKGWRRGCWKGQGEPAGKGERREEERRKKGEGCVPVLYGWGSPVPANLPLRPAPMPIHASGPPLCEEREGRVGWRLGEDDDD